MPADAAMPVGVVIERRVTDGPWQHELWRPIGVLPEVAMERGRRMAEGEGWVRLMGGTLDLELFRGETEGYLTNLSQDPPMVFVVLRRQDGADELEFAPFLVTACPYEAAGYNEGNDDVVEGVPMPPEIIVWVRDFLAKHHVDRPFVKRKNRQHQDDHGRRYSHAVREGGLS